VVDLRAVETNAMDSVDASAAGVEDAEAEQELVSF